MNSCQNEKCQLHVCSKVQVAFHDLAVYVVATSNYYCRTSTMSDSLQWTHVFNHIIQTNIWSVWLYVSILIHQDDLYGVS